MKKKTKWLGHENQKFKKTEWRDSGSRTKSEITRKNERPEVFSLLYNTWQNIYRNFTETNGPVEKIAQKD